MKNKIKSRANEGSTMVIPKFGKARHDQIVRAAWAAEQHSAPAGTAKQPRAKRKAGSYGAH
jgi:hypothetical protein